MSWRNSNDVRAERSARSVLSSHADDIIHRYVVGRESLRKIERHYGVSRETVRRLLRGAGVAMREAGSTVVTRAEPDNEPETRAARLSSRTSEGRTDQDDDAFARADERHVQLICRALKGRGMPFYPAEELRI